MITVMLKLVSKIYHISYRDSSYSYRYWVWETQILFLHFRNISIKTVWWYIWATSLQNQRNGMCAQQRLRSAWASVQSDQSAMRSMGSLGPQLSSCRQRRFCPGWSESLLGAHAILLVLSWGGSFVRCFLLLGTIELWLAFIRVSVT